jgi:hypothetical protein
MSRTSAKEQLVDFLERHAFQPVLRAKESSVPKGKQEELHDLQDRTKTEIERFRHYGTAEDVVTNFRRDLHSSKAREVQGRLKTLDLPTLPDVREDFEALAEKLGVKGRS